LIIPKNEWDRPPHNRWSFHHIREILPTVEVWRGRGPVRELPRNEVTLDALDVGDGRALAQLLDDTYTDGFLVIKDGAITFERYFNGMTERSLHLSQSVAKSVTGAVAGILVGQGKLDAAAPVTDYLPELQKSGWRDATLQHVLDMTTGVSFSEEYTDPLSDIGQVDVASGWKPIPPGLNLKLRWPSHVWELILGLKHAKRRHGDAFEYRSIETDVLAFCMERVTGKRLARLVSDELWRKMGAEESASFTVDSAGYALADGGFNACLRDYGRFGQLILENGGGIIPSQWIAATRNANHFKFGEPYTETLPNGAYHNQFWIEDQEHKSLIARGVFGQLIYISWQYNMVVVKLSSWPDFLNTNYAIATRKACHAIGKLLSGD
jgi:CubicO group peptidase (beta-lactamase class C family)